MGMSRNGAGPSVMVSMSRRNTYTIDSCLNLERYPHNITAELTGHVNKETSPHGVSLIYYRKLELT